MGDSYIALSRYFKSPEFTFYDFFSCVIVLCICLLIAHRVKLSQANNPLYKKYFVPGLIIKMLGGLSFALIYTFYYRYGGDTSGYWGFGTRISMLLFEYPEYWWECFTRDFSSAESFVHDFLRFRWSKSTEEFRVIQITSLIAPLGLMNFYATSMLIAALAYSGVWRLFLLFHQKFPEAEKSLAFAVLFFPTTLVWGSGIMKDTIVFGCLGLLMYSMNALFEKGIYQWKHVAWVAFSVFLIFSIKPYILFSLAPGIIIWRAFRAKEKIKNKFFQRIAVPLFLAGSFVGSLYAIEFIGQYNDQYTITNFVASAQSMQNWHYQVGGNTSEQFGRGSSYSLGYYEPTVEGVLKKFPAAVNVTLFRPYIGESKTFMQFLSALESTAVFLLFLFVVIYRGPKRFFSEINNDSFLILMVSFSLIFAFGVGFSAYNFGALARYKVPCVPFYVSVLFILKMRLSQKFQQSKEIKSLKLYSRPIGV